MHRLLLPLLAGAAAAGPTAAIEGDALVVRGTDARNELFGGASVPGTDRPFVFAGKRVRLPGATHCDRMGDCATPDGRCVSEAGRVRCRPDGIARVRILAGAGNDWLSMLTSANIALEVHGEEGHDEIVGSADPELLTGGPGRDAIDDQYGTRRRRPDADRIDGGPGADQLHSVDGEDTIAGGPGNDFITATGRRAVRVDAGSGNDFVRASARGSVVDCGPGRDEVAATRPRRLVACEIVR